MEADITCPLCGGDGEYGSVRYQPVEGMAYMDAPGMCPGCTRSATRADYPDFPQPTGLVTEERYEELCEEYDLCRGCGEPNVPGYDWCSGTCARDAYEDEMYHRAVDDALTDGGPMP